ncbi:MAG TPA: hypothetical protein VGI63_07865, partial [Verrucomicrobiae bacterium]
LANPVIIEPSSLLAFMIVAFWALVVEAGIVALLLTLSGANTLRMFFAYWLANVLVFLFVFEPLLSSEKASVPLLEVLVVALMPCPSNCCPAWPCCKAMISGA